MKKKFKDELYPVYEIVCDDSEKTGIRMVSIVADPAIELMGVCFNEQGATKDYQFKAQIDKQIIMGPAMVPNQKILRKDETGNKYYNIFRADTIVQLVQKFNSQGTNRRINVDHTNRVVDAYIMEDWIVEDPYYDKSRLYGFNVPVGTWMVSIKIEDEKFWKDEVKELGKFGFSIEGVLGEKPMDYSKVFTSNDVIDNLSDQELHDIMKEFTKYKKKVDFSSNVKRLMYNSDNMELTVEFHNGEIYTYEDVMFSEFEDILIGNGICKTDGKNKYGEWYVGKSPSVGAALYEVLVEGSIPFRRGGSFN